MGSPRRRERRKFRTARPELGQSQWLLLVAAAGASAGQHPKNTEQGEWLRRR